MKHPHLILSEVCAVIVNYKLSGHSWHLQRLQSRNSLRLLHSPAGGVPNPAGAACPSNSKIYYTIQA